MEAVARSAQARATLEGRSGEVDRVRAALLRLVSSSFPRSWGGIKAVEVARSPDIADLGFDVLYLLPFHPIGVNKRKGRNNTPRRRARRPRAQPVRDRRRREGEPLRRPP